VQSTEAKMPTRERETYQNGAENLSSLLFIFELDDECKSLKTKH